MAKITYADKSVGGVGDAGKFKSTDANEIKTSVNALYDLQPKKVSITSSGTPIVFTTPVPIDTPFEVFPVSCMLAGQSVGVYFEDITRFGFTAYSAEPDATLLYNVLTFPE